MKARVLIIGISGFIGRYLGVRLSSSGFQVTGTSRDPVRLSSRFDSSITIIQWDGLTPNTLANRLGEFDAVINLAGDNLGTGRWTRAKKRRILDSRINSGLAVTEALRQITPRPAVLLQASAVGYYGDRGDERLDESSSPGTGFLAEVVKQWEASTDGLSEINVRRVLLRSGIVLGKSGGLLQRLILPFRLFLGGWLGSGDQWMSWIHIDDFVSAVTFLLQRENLAGVFNLTAPEPVRNKDLTRTLGGLLNRPSMSSIPAWALRIAFGEAADQMILASQRVISRNLPDAGFSFTFPTADTALRDLV